jgi:hypothetical protein
MFFNNKDSQNEIHHLNQATTLEISESSPLDAIFSNTRSKPSSTYNPFNLPGIIKMKHQAKNAVALSLLSSLLMMGGTAEANINVLTDIENNDSKANKTGFLFENNSRVLMLGSLSQTDKADTFSIVNYGGHDGTIEWSFTDVNTGKNMQVWEDTNKNKKIDNSDRYLFAVSSGNKRIKISDKGTQYLARVYGKAGDYVMNAVVYKTVKLNVISAKNYGKFDGGRNNKPDFYVKTQIYRSKRHQSKTIGNNNNPVFNHRHQETYSPYNGLVPLSIDLYDSDRFSKDDQADIHPNPKSKRLDLVYDLLHKQIRTDDGRVLGKPGQAITVKGDRPGNSQASVTFIVR